VESYFAEAAHHAGHSCKARMCRNLGRSADMLVEARQLYNEFDLGVLCSAEENPSKRRSDDWRRWYRRLRSPLERVLGAEVWKGPEIAAKGHAVSCHQGERP